MNALVTHSIIELRDCNPEILKNLEKVRSTMVAAAKEMGIKIIDICFHEFNPFGISGIVVINKAHLSIHTWPEYDYAAVDVFVVHADISETTSFLVKTFESKNLSIMDVKRGINMNLPRRPDWIIETESALVNSKQPE